MIPDLTEVFLIEAKTDTPAFKSWFRGSKVVGPDGQPEVVYHGTDVAQNFQHFDTENSKDIGSHFGTSQAANDRLGGDSLWTKAATPEGINGRVYPCYLSIQKPLDMEDMEFWEPKDIAAIARSQNIISPEEYDEVVDRVGQRGRRTTLESLRKLLKSKGIDGIKYKNDIEEPGSTSWIIFDPNQAKSIFNKGTWSRKSSKISE